MKKYQYVGPEEIFTSVEHFPKGRIVFSLKDVLDWIRGTGQILDYDGCVIATFIIDENENLRIADRHSEYVACAGRQPVFSAGEITFEIADKRIFVSNVTNQSTGYCPESNSWIAVENALNSAEIENPGKFTTEFIFRRCTACGSINIVKDHWFTCIECDADLDKEWNFS